MDDFENFSEALKRVAYVCRIILFALIMGILISFFFLSFPRLGKVPFDKGFDLILIGPALAGIVASLIIPPIITMIKRKELVQKVLNGQKLEPNMLLQVFQEQLITRAACLEMPAFTYIFLFNPESKLWALFSMGILIMGILCLFPSQDKIKNWLKTQMELIELEQ